MAGADEKAEGAFEEVTAVCAVARPRNEWIADRGLRG
jgi:hypothetical protein